MPAKTSKGRILIVDDALFIRKTLSQFLSEHDYEIAGEAANGVEAVKLYAEIMPDVVLMDISMPLLDGIRAIKVIAKIDPNARIIMISAMGQKTLVTESVRSGARSFIVKPFTPEKVLETIDKVLNTSYAPIALPEGSGVIIRNVLLAAPESPTFQKIMGLLKDNGYKVTTTQKGSEAIDLLTDSHVELIITASRFGEIPATEVVRKIKSDDLKKHIPIIMFGPSLAAEQIRDLGSLGISKYIVEPVSLDEILGTITNLDALTLEALKQLPS